MPEQVTPRCEMPIVKSGSRRPTASDYAAVLRKICGLLSTLTPLEMWALGASGSHVTGAGVHRWSDRPRERRLRIAHTRPHPHVPRIAITRQHMPRSYAVNTFTCHLNISSTNQYSIIRRGRFQTQLRAHTEIARQTISKTIVLSPTCPRPTNIARSPTLNPHSQFRAYRGLANRFSPLIIHEARVGPARKSISDKQEVWIKR